jgi:hypothetical protein
MPEKFKLGHYQKTSKTKNPNSGSKTKVLNRQSLRTSHKQLGGVLTDQSVGANPYPW